jgi:hypothetical protein
MAQLAVAVALEAICWRFESSYTYQFIVAEGNITKGSSGSAAAKRNGNDL